MALLDIAKSIYLLDFYERRTNTILHATSLNLNEQSNYFKNNYSKLYRSRNREPYKFYDYSFKQTLTQQYPTIQNILKLGNGNISLCGLCVLDIMAKQNVNQFNLYLHSCNIDLAKELILESLRLLNGKIFYGSKHLYVRLRCCNIRFDLQIYDNKEEILKTIGSAPDRHGWNPVNGYFSTICGILSLAMKVLFIDDVPNTEELERYPSRDITLVAHKNKRIPSENIQRNSTHHIIIHDCNLSCMYFLSVVFEPREKMHTINLIGVQNNIHKLITLQSNKQQYIRKNYNPDNSIIVGISNDEYVAFSSCKRNFNLPDDLFRLLCDYWLRALVLDTANALLH